VSVCLFPCRFVRRPRCGMCVVHVGAVRDRFLKNQNRTFKNIHYLLFILYLPQSTADENRVFIPRTLFICIYIYIYRTHLTFRTYFYTYNSSLRRALFAAHRFCSVHKRYNRTNIVNVVTVLHTYTPQKLYCYMCVR